METFYNVTVNTKAKKRTTQALGRSDCLLDPRPRLPLPPPRAPPPPPPPPPRALAPALLSLEMVTHRRLKRPTEAVIHMQVRRLHKSLFFCFLLSWDAGHPSCDSMDTSRFASQSLVQALSAWSVKNPTCSVPRHCGDTRVYDDTITYCHA